MTKTAAIAYELRWRKTADPENLWAGQMSVPATGNITVPGLDDSDSYTFEARAISACGAKSAWVTQTQLVDAVAGAPQAPTSLTASTVADGVHLVWTVSATEPANVEYEIQRANDSSGSPSGWATLTKVRALAYTDAFNDGALHWYRVRAVDYLGSTSAFTTQLSAQGFNVTGSGGLKDVANEAASNATAALAAAANANDAIADIADDGLLTPAEKKVIIREYGVITGEQFGIDTQATTFGITTAKTDYDNAVSALTTYLGTLTTPTHWDDLSGNTTVVRATFEDKFNEVYLKRQVLLNAIYVAAKALADAAQHTADTAVTNGDDARAIAQGNAPLVPNGNMLNGLTGFNVGTGWAAIPVAGGAKFTGYAGAISSFLTGTTIVPVKPGQIIYVQATVEAASASGTCGSGLVFYDSSGAQLTALSSTTTATGTTGAAVLSSLRMQVPTGATGVAPFAVARNCTSGTFTVDGIAMTVAAIATQDDLPDGTTRYAAAEPGANKTETRTSADTAKVNGVAASSISPIGALMPSEAGAERTTGKSVDILADGTNFRRTGSGYIDTSGRPYRLWDGTAIREAVDVWDGANRARTGFDSSGYLVDQRNALTLLSGRTADNISETDSKRWAGQSNANLIRTSNFESGATGIWSEAAWVIGTAGAIGDTALTRYLKVASGGSGVAAQVIPANPGDKLVVECLAWTNSGGAGTAQFAMRFIDATGTTVAYDGPTLAGNLSWTRISKVVTVPANTVGMSPAVFVNGSTYSAFTDFQVRKALASDLGAGIHAYVDFGDDASGGHVGKHLGNLPDDATSHRAALDPADIYLSGGYNRVGLRIPGSGHTIGDQRNLVSSITRNLGLVRSATALTAYSTGAVNVNAHTITLGGASVGYNAKTNAVTGLSTGSSYYIYTRDNYAGGSPTWSYSTSSASVNSYDDAYNAGVVTIPSSGSSGGGAGGGGPIDDCVGSEMWLRRGLTARRLAERWRWWRPYLLRGQDGWHFVRQQPRIVLQPCCRITVADGSTLDCSNSTPVTTSTGESVQAPMLHGHFVATDSGWQRVINVELLRDQREVVRICVGGHSFFAGADAHRRISTHNIWKK